MKTFAAGNICVRMDGMQDERVGAHIDGVTESQVEDSDERWFAKDKGWRQQEEQQVEDDPVAGQRPEDDPRRDSLDSATDEIAGNFVQVSRGRSTNLKVYKKLNERKLKI